MLAPDARLVLATHNKGKLREVQALLAPHGIAAVSAGELGLPEPPETGTTFAENARIKALAAASATSLPALADDSGFSVAALDGAPGVYTADWAMRPDGTRDYAMAMEKVNAQCAGSPDMRAWFNCALCLAWPDGRTATFMARVEGMRIWPPRGDAGFGYDPMFVPAGGTRTYGEMPAEEKHRDSHRGRAFRQFALACLPR